MKKKELTANELRTRLIELRERMQAMNDKAEAEGCRAFTAEEEQQWAAAKAEVSIIQRSLDLAALSPDEAVQREVKDVFLSAATMPRITTERANSGKRFREALKTKGEVAIELREATFSTEVGAAIPVYVQDFIEPLERGLIYDLVGAKIKYGLSGTESYPIAPYIEATIAGEKVKIEDTTITLKALQPKPQKLGIACKLSGLANIQTDGAVYSWLVAEVVKAVARTLNHWMFRTTAIAEGVRGVFVYDADANPIHQKSFASKLPTYLELVQMRGSVMSTGAYSDGTYAYVMSAEMYSALEATPITEGGDRMIITDGKIGGFPVYLTEDIEYTTNSQKNVTPKHVGFGRWSDALLGQFGGMRLVIDPYTDSSSDITQVTLNTYWAVDPIRPKSFVIGTVSA